MIETYISISTCIIYTLWSQYFGHLMWRADSFEKTLMLGKTEGRRRKGWQRMRCSIASLTQWTWTWANSRRYWGAGRPGVLQSMGLQRVGHDWATNLTELIQSNAFIYLSNAEAAVVPALLFGGPRNRVLSVIPSVPPHAPRDMDELVVEPTHSSKAPSLLWSPCGGSCFIFMLQTE